MRCRHGLGGRAAGMREDGRGLGVAGLLVCERGRRSRGAWRGWKIMDGPVAVLYWLVDGEHPRLSEWGDGGAEQQQQKRLDAGVQRLQDGRRGGGRQDVLGVLRDDDETEKTGGGRGGNNL